MGAFVDDAKPLTMERDVRLELAEIWLKIQPRGGHNFQSVSRVSYSQVVLATGILSAM